MDTSFGGELMKNVWKKRKDNKIKRKQRKNIPSVVYNPSLRGKAFIQMDT